MTTESRVTSFSERAEKNSAGASGNRIAKKRQFVFMSDFDVEGEKFRRVEEHAHVAVQMRGINSESDGALNLAANFSFSFLGPQIAGRGDSVPPQIAGGIEEACDFVF